MANFTKKVFGLAGAAVVFAGMAFGQAATCAAPTATTNIIRAEGTTEQVAALTFVCTTIAGGTGTAAGTASLQIFMSPALPVTSKGLVAPATEATLTMTPSVGAAVVVAGTISGSTVNFSPIPLGILPAAGTYTFVVTSIRVNATSLSVGSGVPPSVSETPFISGSTGTLVPAALASTQVAFAQNGLAATKLFKTFTATAFPAGTVTTSSGANNFVICNAYKPSPTVISPASGALGTGAGLAFVVQVGENFTSAFKSAVQESPQTGAALVNGTRVNVNFTNVPAGVTVYVPNAGIPSLTAGAPTTTLQWTTAGVGTAPPAPSGAPTTASLFGTTGFTAANGVVPVAIASGSGTAVFEVTAADPNTLDVFNIPVFVTTSANGVTASSTGIGVSVSFAPVGATTIPNFVVGASTNSLTGSVFNTCTTSLMFPFVTNQLGFDTGIAISNTSTDPFGTLGATAQAGTCSLNFYGSGAPSPANVTTPNVPTGTVYTQVLSGVASGFQGYIIAQCNFQYAHGFAFITNGVGVNGGLSQGYLAGVIPDVNQVLGRPANPLAVAGAGTGESFGN